MKKTIITLTLAAVACFSLQAENHDHAHLSAQHMAENDLNIGYVSYELEGMTLRGAKISHGTQYDSGFYLRAGYEYATTNVMGETLKLQDLTAFAGKQFTIDSSSLIYVEGGIHFIKASYRGFSDNSTEFEAAAGYKHALTHNLAATIGARYMDSEVAGEVGMKYSFTEMFALSASYTKAKDTDKVGLGLNVYF